MSIRALDTSKPARDGVSEAEWETRVQLAAAYRVTALQGWTYLGASHISARVPGEDGAFLLNPHGLFFEEVTASSLIKVDHDGNQLTESDYGVNPAGFTIHGAILAGRPDVNSVVHNHSHAVIPFTVTGAKLRPMIHVGAAIGSEIPVWDIRDKFGDTNLLVVDMDQGRDLARCLGDARVALMRGHGCAVAGANVQHSVMTAVYLQVAAGLQREAMAMGEVRYLSDEEVRLCSQTFAGELSVNRVWEYLARKAGMADY